MSRNWRCSVAVALAGLGLVLSGCSSNDGSTPVGPAVGPSYVHGDFQGSLAVALINAFSPMTWSGQTDGPVLVAADQLFTLSEDQKTALRMVLSEGHAVLLSEVTQEHLERLHAATGRVPAIVLEPNDSAALYVLTQPRGMMHVLVVKSAPDWLDPAEVESSKTTYAQEVAGWFLEQRTLHAARSAALARASYEEASEPAILSGDSSNLPFLVKQVFTMPVFYSDQCGEVKSCFNLGSATLSSWGVHNAKAPVDQPTDYLIMRLTGTFNTDGCKLSIGSNNRFAGLWLRQAEMSANVADVTLEGYRLPDGAFFPDDGWAPLAVNPEETKTTGVTFTMGGGGTLTAGATQKGPSLSGSVAWNAGVSYTNTSTVGPLHAVSVSPLAGADANNRTKVRWSYDSWNFVRDHIKPANHACGGPGLKIDDALSPYPIIYGGAFNAKQEWVWALDSAVRRHLPIQSDDFAYVPVEFNASELLGWAMFGPFANACQQKEGGAGQYLYHFTIGSQSYSVVGQTIIAPPPGAPSVGLDPSGKVTYVTAHSNGLAFDPGCGTAVHFGTIPLGNPTVGVMDGTNVGPLFSFGNIRTNVPLAPDPRLMRLTSISTRTETCQSTDCAVHGYQGTTVTLRGAGLQTATGVSFGGLPPATQSMDWMDDPTNPGHKVAYLTVTAPNRVAPVGKAVDVAVANPATTTTSFQFIYTE